jgi:hypothetical protein
MKHTAIQAKIHFTVHFSKIGFFITNYLLYKRLYFIYITTYILSSYDDFSQNNTLLNLGIYLVIDSHSQSSDVYSDVFHFVASAVVHIST